MSGADDRTARRPTDAADAAVAVGAETLVDVLAELATHGFAGSFTAREPGDGAPTGSAQVSCGSCATAFPAAEFQVEYERRLEGASDAADLMFVAAGRCPGCGEGGSLTLTYGPNASIADAAVLEALDVHRASAAPLQD
ncbi:MAG: hypothetical protein KDB21_12480 [Acidimicrobiales bacterium]|nr:hypothetical protein [Acidimicrobiales bacterium]